MKIITPLLIALTLTACSGEDGTATEPAAGNGANTQPGSSTSETKSVSDLRSNDMLKESIVKSIAPTGISRKTMRGVCCGTTGRLNSPAWIPTRKSRLFSSNVASTRRS